MALKRYKDNPVITPADVQPSCKGFRVIGAFNPGATVYEDQVILLLRTAEKCIEAEGKIRVPAYDFAPGGGTPRVLEFDRKDPDLVLKDTRGVVYKGTDYLSSASHIRVARSDDGVHFRVDERPFIFPGDPSEKYGIEDARATYMDGKYYINYSIVSEDSWCTALSVTGDFISHKKLGIIFHPENKDVAIFPEKVNGKYCALHRPNNNGFGKPSIWYAESPDLLHWGNHRCLLRPRPDPCQAMKIGGGAPPVKTDRGWLVIYHAKGEDSRYALFPLLLETERPWVIKKHPEEPLLVPEMPYETEGFYGNVVFTNGMVERDGKLFIYYGAADESTCLAVTTVHEVLEAM